MNSEESGISLVTLYHPPPGYPTMPTLSEDLRVRPSFTVWRNPGEGSTHTKLEDVDPEDVRQRLLRYYETYYSELRERMSRYAVMTEIFPDVLLGPRHIVAQLAADGVVAIHWPAQEDAFEFDTVPGHMVQDLTGLHRLGAPSGRSATFFQYETGIDFGAYAMWRPELIEGQEVIKPKWTRMDIASLDALDSVLSETEAKDLAQKQVWISAEAYLIGLGRVPPGSREQDQIATELEVAINEFEELLETAAQDERKIQMFLGTRRNQMLLEPRRVSVTREVTIGHTVADFVIEMPGQRYLLVEIEKPIYKMFTKEGRFTKETTHAQQQVEDWINWIRDYPTEFRERILPGIREPQGWVVIGRRRDISESHQRTLEGKNARLQDLTVMTFDDLIDNARQHVENLRGLGSETL